MSEQKEPNPRAERRTWRDRLADKQKELGYVRAEWLTSPPEDEIMVLMNVEIPPATPPDGQSCGRCRFWQHSYVNPGRDVQPGECRKNAPVLQLSGFTRQTVFPAMASEEWCGEWQPRSA